MKIIDNGNGEKIFTNVKNDDIYKEIVEMRKKLELLTSPEWREGSCPYKTRINGVWKSIGIFAGLAAVVGGILGSILMRFM